MPLTHADDELKESKLDRIFENQSIRIRDQFTRCCDAAGLESLTSPKSHVSPCSEDS